MAMKTAESDQQKQQGSGRKSPDVASQSAPTNTVVAPPTTASEEGLQLLVQARLSVSSPNDPFEHEAESMADEFVKSIHGRTVSAPSSSAGSVARSVPDSGLVEGGGGLATTDDTASAIMSARAGGQALSGDVRARFEGFFGADLGGVKIHNDGTSDNLCRSINAEAFTTGNDVFFSSRNFKPGSSSGDHLLAHELTHVVQQGNAPALSRSALPDIQRWNPFADKTRQKVADAGGMAALGKLGTAANGGLKGHSHDAQGNYVAPDAQSESVRASATTGGALSIVADTAALLNAIIRLYTEWDIETTASVRDQLILGVKSALSVCQGSTTIAASASAALVAFGALPALGIAYSTIDLAFQSIKIHETRLAKSAADEKLAQLNTKSGVRDSNEKKLLASLTNLAASAEDEYIRSAFRLTADIISISGQITVLATGASVVGAAVGGALIGIGAGIQGLVLLQSKVSQWMNAGAVHASRYAVTQAEDELKAHKDSLGDNPSDDDKARTKELEDRVDDMAVKNLGLDAYSAACELIKHSAQLFGEEGEVKKTDPEAIALVGKFNISEAWMMAYIKNGSKPEVLDKGARLICEFVGKSPDAQGLVDDLKAAASYVAKGIKWVASAGYWMLKFAGKVVVSLAITPVALLVGWFGQLINKPELGDQFIDLYEKTAVTVGTAVEDGAVGLFNAAKDRVVGKTPEYFTNSLDVQTRTSEAVLPLIRTYFDSKAERGTDVKPDSVTSKLKTPYKQLIATSKVAHSDGSKAFTSWVEQMIIVDKTVKAIIEGLVPDRVDKNSIVVQMGVVSFTYKGGDKAKTKGWFAGWRGREAVED